MKQPELMTEGVKIMFTISEEEYLAVVRGFNVKNAIGCRKIEQLQTDLAITRKDRLQYVEFFQNAEKKVKELSDKVAQLEKELDLRVKDQMKIVHELGDAGDKIQKLKKENQRLKKKLSKVLNH